MQAAQALHANDIASIMINSNPETVSTDFDASDRLYFEPWTVKVSPRCFATSPKPMRSRSSDPSVWGANRYQSRGPLANRGVPILGSQLDSIDLAEDRHRFEGFLRGLAIPQPPGAAVTTLDDARSVAGQNWLSRARAAIVRSRRSGYGSCL